MILIMENPRTWRKTCPSTTLSMTNPTCTALGVSLALRGEKPVTNRLSYGTARTGDITDTFHRSDRAPFARSTELLRNNTGKGLRSNLTHLITYL
jgi:hypothetical protein